MKSVTVQNYSKDKYYPRVLRVIARILIRSDVVTPVDVLMEMGNLTMENHDSWRRGQVLYLERVFKGNLSKASRILRIIGFRMHDLNMVPRRTIYRQRGKGKKHLLRFSKSGNKRLEEAYATHYVWNQSQEKKREIIDRTIPNHGLDQDARYIRPSQHDR
jgi:hypothetical protein